MVRAGGSGEGLGRVRSGFDLVPIWWDLGWIWVGSGLDLGWIWVGSGLDLGWIWWISAPVDGVILISHQRGAAVAVQVCEVLLD